MARIKFTAPELYINRELSWLEFNDRVLREGLCEELPLLERLKFLSIVSSNLDEFFMVRVAGLMQQRSAGVRRRDPAGMTPGGQLAAIAERAHRMAEEQSAGIADVLNQLAELGLRVDDRAQWSDDQRRFLRSYFTKNVHPVLTPLAPEELDPPPLLRGLQLHVAAVLAAAPKLEADEQPEDQIVVVPVPAQFTRFVTVPGEEGLHLARLEDVISENIGTVFPGREVSATATFRITRDADVSVSDDDASDLLQAMEEAVLARRRRAATRLEVSADPDTRLKKWLTGWSEVRPEDIYEIDGMLDAAALWDLAGRPGFEQLKVADWPPQPPRDLIGSDDLWQTIQDRDVLLFHPYERFDPVVQLVEQAAADPQVLAIKQTLYRTSGDSPIIRALARAAQDGKEVTVLVELKARFDEARNVNWARQLEDAGCHVIYGIAGFKTHAKAMLIVRRESKRIRRYVHLGTGNYNDGTARVYSDLGMFTCDREMTADVAAFFNLLTGYSEPVGWSKLAVAPTGLRQRFLDLIEREIRASSPDRPGLIMAKLNSLEDQEICQALYRASQAGVKIQLNVRGICCLRPGVKKFSETIEVCSIVDRFLEHARIFYFRNGGHEEVYLSSADWMRRNLSKRLEILFPVGDPSLRRRVIGILKTCFADNQKAHALQSDGTYERITRKKKKGKRVRAQEKFHNDALDAVHTAEQAGTQFRPLVAPKP
ncbi:MAG: polyphosphate kinase 1 [Planctomycetes bacterium]|nr:polyphosphate kinase 1 [Planctomycetota bacterium]